MHDLKYEPPFKLARRKLYQVAFCSPEYIYAFVLSLHLYRKYSKTMPMSMIMAMMMTMIKMRRRRMKYEENNDDEVDETNVCPLWLVYNELVARRHKNFSKHLLSDATP